MRVAGQYLPPFPEESTCECSLTDADRRAATPQVRGTQANHHGGCGRRAECVARRPGLGARPAPRQLCRLGAHPTAYPDYGRLASHRPAAAHVTAAHRQAGSAPQRPSRRRAGRSRRRLAGGARRVLPGGRTGHPAGLHDRPPDPHRRVSAPGCAVHGHPCSRARASRSGAALPDEHRAGGLAAG